MVIIENFPICDLSGIDSLYINSIKKVFGFKPSGGMSLDVVLANNLVLKFYDMGTYLILNAEKELVMSLINL